MEAVRLLNKVSTDVEKYERTPHNYDTKSEKGNDGRLEDGRVVVMTKENASVVHQILDLEANLNPKFTLKSDPSSSSSHCLREKSIEELRELYLEKLYKEKQGPHEFYCPNCKVCITKVLVKDQPKFTPNILDEDDDDDQIGPIRCTSCFSFLIPTGTGTITVPELLPGPLMDPRSGSGSGSEHEQRSEWEMMKSIVYGGLAESITSLGIVTSAASGDASTLNIVALALANLIGGLFVIAHNLWDLKHDHLKVRTSDDVTEEQSLDLDRYEAILGKRRHFGFHTLVSILSFLVFGLVPPVVYGFSFRERNDKDLKLAAVAAASLLCIALLSFAKAYTQKHSKYIKTATYYVVVGFGVSGASYLAGVFVNKMMKRLGWFEPSPTTSAMPVYLGKMSMSAWDWE
ncbi:membrane protein of ER body-like protein [Humulus lupulus]|uniref:membrane protein of ER body-like protein n=1 Tax=Humulus lupulus TaxID=3486 RepID=UPI002B40C398|nr:membrane protein of ER body-like protein [Humulus lupulus]